MFKRSTASDNEHEPQIVRIADSPNYTSLLHFNFRRLLTAIGLPIWLSLLDVASEIRNEFHLQCLEDPMAP